MEKFLPLNLDEERAVLYGVQQLISALSSFDVASLETSLRAWAQEMQIPFKHVAQLIRKALTGQTVSPPLFQVMEILGQQECVNRLQTAFEYWTIGCLAERIACPLHTKN